MRQVLLILFIGFSIQLLGQQYEYKETFSYPSDYPTTIHQLIFHNSGQMIAVGQSSIPNLGEQGVLLFIDAITGEQIGERKYFGGAGDDRFLGVCKAYNGDIYMVGSSSPIGEKKSDAWILRTNADGSEILLDTLLGTKGDDALQHIIWTKSGKGLAIGYQEKPNNGNVWMLEIEKNQITSKNDLTNAAFCWDVIALKQNIQGEVFLVGNTKKTKNTAKGDIWIQRFSKDLNRKGSPFLYGNPKYDEVVKAVYLDPKNRLIIVGESWNKGIGERAAWLLDIDGSLKESTVKEKSFTDLDYAQSTGVHTTLQEHYLMLVNEPNGLTFGTLHHLLHVEKELRFPEKPVVLPDSQNFIPITCIRNHELDYVIAGNAVEATYDLKLFQYHNGGYTTSKGVSDIECVNFRVQDDNNNGVWTVNEKGTIFFDISSSKEDLIAVEIEVKLDKSNNNIELIEGNKRFFDFIQKGVNQQVAIPIKVLQKFADCTVGLVLNIKVKGQEALQLPIKLEFCKQQTSKSGQTVGYYRKIPSTDDNGVVYPKDTLGVLELKLDDKTGIKIDEIKIYVNQKLIKNAKSGTEGLSNPFINNQGIYSYDYNCNFPLEQGENKVVVVIGKDTLDQFTYQYQPRKPNLYAVVIAPDYSETNYRLSYNQKDAIDFVDVIWQQADRGLFANIKVDTLTSKQLTEDLEIPKYLQTLASSFEKDKTVNYLRKQDVVIFYYSGHGLVHDNNFKLMSSSYDPNSPDYTLVDYKTDVLKHLAKIKCKRLLFIDACLSGSATGKAVSDFTISQALNELNESQAGITTISSCSTTERSYEDSSWENGAFTEALIEALNGQKVKVTDDKEINADSNNDKMISIEELYEFLRQRVPYLVAPLGLDQHPYMPENKIELAQKLKFFILP